MSFLDRIRECNEHDLSDFIPFVIAGERVGQLRRLFAARLAAHKDVFTVSAGAVVLAEPLENADADTRTTAVNALLEELSGRGAMPPWRDELHAVATDFSRPPAMALDRSAITLFGVRGFGVHMNGWVRKADGIHMWVARRAADLNAFPGMLDNMVAGGQPVGLGLKENILKEAAEEAGLPEVIAGSAVSTGAITYCKEVDDGIKQDVIYTFDLELPEDVVPHPADGEVEDFYLWPVEKVMQRVAETNEFKFNCNLVIIDFLIRHGLIAADDPDYLAILTGLRI